MSPSQQRKCCHFTSIKTGTTLLALINCVGSMIGATWAIILITTLPHQVSKFKGLNRMYVLEGDQQEAGTQMFEIALWTIIILYLMVFTCNIVFSIVVLHGVRTANPSCLTPWFWWTGVSFLILIINFLVKTFALMFSLPDLVICLSCMVVNIYLGLVVFSLRKQLREQLSTGNEIK
eukprot:GFUD01019661.1.p1 GENE.GFUD01019661.1~~GFUD01019661.1.p1  ORF type:complete len:177 (+),score=47.41 GFUD01019661.1:145-675(+)